MLLCVILDQIVSEICKLALPCLLWIASMHLDHFPISYLQSQKIWHFLKRKIRRFEMKGNLWNLHFQKPRYQTIIDGCCWLNWTHNWLICRFNPINGCFGRANPTICPKEVKNNRITRMPWAVLSVIEWSDCNWWSGEPANWTADKGTSGIYLPHNK